MFEVLYQYSIFRTLFQTTKTINRAVSTTRGHVRAIGSTNEFERQIKRVSETKKNCASTFAITRVWICLQWHSNWFPQLWRFVCIFCCNSCIVYSISINTKLHICILRSRRNALNSHHFLWAGRLDWILLLHSTRFVWTEFMNFFCLLLFSFFLLLRVNHDGFRLKVQLGCADFCWVRSSRWWLWSTCILVWRLYNDDFKILLQIFRDSSFILDSMPVFLFFGFQ